MAALIWIVLGTPIAGAALAGAFRRADWTRFVPLVAAVMIMGCGGVLIAVTRASGAVVAGSLLRVDTFSAWFLMAVGAVALIAIWGGTPTREQRREEGNQGGFWALMCAFLAAMTLALVADNLGLVWVAIEATTITTAFLVGYGRGRQSLEAAWKYVVLGSVGVAIAFLGIVLIYAASVAGGEPTLSWLALTRPGTVLTPAILKMGVGLAALGFATKAGLAPMHSWLPDAHSQAPAPVSGLMSGVLLAVALYAILRVQVIADRVLGPGLFRGLLIAAGLLSLLVTALLVLTQRDFKRLLAYSSIEHMGLMALAAAVGGRLALAALLLHVLGHGLVKASMFVAAGRIMHADATHDIGDVVGLLRRRPDLGIPFLAGGAALLCFPPFVTFFTEVAILIALAQGGLGWVAGAAVVLLLAVFAGLARHLLAMTMGGPDVPPSPATPARLRRTLPLALALGAAAVLGFVAMPLSGVLTDAVAALTGGR
ncbi:MAG TPA: proton-conducting transporter membrane subunit [Propioniciclava tarda]|nr:proton-conducting transporter membrane subunit [Propioniciclava tarda]HQA30502.1 proton-conducting transporter membrane subunit [Propioniciclava tarda]HQD61151.1 proton-conducting transporter membrane subunit [Propioniciclava tarda]